MKTPSIITVVRRTYLGTIKESVPGLDEKLIKGIEVGCPDKINQETFANYIKKVHLKEETELKVYNTSIMIEQPLNSAQLANWELINKCFKEAELMTQKFITVMCFDHLLGK